MTSLRSRLESAIESRKRRQILRSLEPRTDVAVPDDELVDLSSNDYLSLSKDPRLRTNLLRALSESDSPPYGPASSRLLDGNSGDHRQLEARLSSFFRAESALLFNSGFDANVGLWSCLPGEDDYITFDELIHASTHDGMRASRVPQHRRRAFKHSDVDSLRQLLLKWVKDDVSVAQGKVSVWIAVEGLYSMDGDVAPLNDIVLCVESCLPAGNGHIVVDEAHSTGLYGENGRGLVCALGLANRVSIRLHTFGKAMACSGGVVLCDPLIRLYLINYARPLIYSTAMTRMSTIAISKSLEMFEHGLTEEACAKVHEMSADLISRLYDLLDYDKSPIRLPAYILPSSEAPLVPLNPLVQQVPRTSPIVPLLTARPRLLSAFLRERGFLVRPIAYPTVPRGQERVRLCLHALNTREQIDKLVQAVREWRKSDDAVQAEARL